MEESKENTLEDRWYPEILVLGPGGYKGFLELGALFYLDSKSLLEKVRVYAGVSVGAIISLLLVCGLSIKQIIAEAVDTNTNMFLDISSIKVGDTFEKSGLISNEPIEKLLTKLIIGKLGCLPTMEQLYMITNIEFITITYNLDKDISEKLDRHSHPNMSCIQAVMLSMNIPLLFYKLYYNDMAYGDGALGNPYPIDLFDNGVDNILGVYIDEKVASIRESSIYLYVWKIIHAPMAEIRRRIISGASNKCKHLKLVTPIFDTIGVTMNAKIKAQMILSGYESAKEFLNNIWSNRE